MLRRCCLTASLLLLAACSRSESAAPAPSPAPVAAPAPPPAPVVEDTTFRLSLAAPAEGVGPKGALQLTLEPRGGYHVNEEYPIRVDLKPRGVQLSKGSLVKSDAVQLTDQIARFELPYTAEPGTHELVATVDFAVCTKETCVPDQRTVALSLQVP